MKIEEYVWANESETVTEAWHTILPDGQTYGAYRSFEEAVEREPSDREFLLQVYAELVANGSEPSFQPRPAAVEVVLVRMVTKTVTESVIVERRPMNGVRA